MFSLLISFFIYDSGLAITEFEFHQFYTDSLQFSICSGDMDDDGDIDIISSGNQGFSIWLNDGDLNFTEQIIPTTQRYGDIVKVADFDNDGDLDIICSSLANMEQTFQEVRWYENNGELEFDAHQVFADSAFRLLEVVDLDSDDDMDFVARIRQHGTNWFEYGEGNFMQHPIMGDLESFQVADLDEDGDRDIIGGYQEGANDLRLIYLENDGDQNFDEQILVEGRTAVQWATWILDFDYDGDLDVITSGDSTENLLWFENDGEENFTLNRLHLYFNELYCQQPLIPADFDCDGDYDIACMYRTIKWFEGLENGSYITHYLDTGYGEEPRFFGNDKNDMVVVDIDNDGDMDIIGSVWGDSSIYIFENEFEPRLNEFSLISPENDLIANGPTIDFTWEDAIDPDSAGVTYTLYLSTDENYSDCSEIDNGDLTSITVEDLENSQYWWKVQARHDTGHMLWSNEIRTFVMANDVEAIQALPVPTEYSIASVYPNPFNPVLHVVVGLPETSELKMTIHNIMGQQVALLEQGTKVNGYHRYSFNADALSSGIYFVRAVVPGKMNELRKVVLIR